MMTRLFPLCLLLILSACGDEKPTSDTGGLGSVDPEDDADGDGFAAPEDCDDEDGSINPGIAETCNGIDDNCDGETDEGVEGTWYRDADGDGFGDPEAAESACEPPDNTVSNDQDCDDDSPTTWPGAHEICNEADDDCDGETDEGVLPTWYTDGDGDGFGDPLAPVDACTRPEDAVDNSDDCDDTTAEAHPEGIEFCDEIDNDCDDLVDEGVTTTFWVDLDGDGWGDASSSTQACARPTGYAEDAGDCDDTDLDISPSGTEVCDEIDNDCDSVVDEPDAADARRFHADDDGDSYGDASSSTVACAAPAGHVEDANDCDDADATIHPAATEVCDSDDNDCDGSIDDDDSSLSGAPTWYGDGDADGHGGSRFSVAACIAPSGYVSSSNDCDDLEPTAFPGGTEVCDELDNDCDGSTDEGAAAPSTFYADEDGDGYGDASDTEQACTAPTGFVSDSTDCDDDDSTVRPGASETCDGEDDDCDGTSDDGLLGSGSSCAALSCADVLSDRPGASSGSYWLDPDGSGSSSYLCDMSTNGGGWTLVAGWNRIDDGDTLSDFEATFTEVTNNMSLWRSGTTYIEWADNNATADMMSYKVDVVVPNDGEVITDVHYRGNSMEQSAVWFYVTAGGSYHDVMCKEDLQRGAYTAAELSHEPYSCSSSAATTWTWNLAQQDDFGAEVTSFHLSSGHYDTYGDDSRLYHLEIWVR